MPVMNIRQMNMRVRQRFVDVKMVVHPLALTTGMRMLMVFVIHVGMRVGEPRVPVEVAMHFPVKQQHARKHDQRGRPEHARRMFPENNHRKQCADERTRCEQGARPRRTDLPQSINEKN